MSTAQRRQAVEIYLRGLENTRPELLLQRALSPRKNALKIDFLGGSRTVKRDPAGSLFLLAIGKAAAPLAAEANRLLPGRIAEGLIVTKEGFALPDPPFPLLEAAHPVPDERGIAAASAVEAMLKRIGKNDLLLVLVSGGASALLPAPIAGVSLREKQELISLMLKTEMDIHQINRVRKALSRLKGGGLATGASPGPVVGLYLSDVTGDDPAGIGSGPTVPESVDGAAVISLLREKGLWEQAPPSIRTVLESGRAERKKPLPAVPPVNGVIGANRHLLRAMETVARDAGYLTHVRETPLTGLNAQALPRLLARWKDFARRNPGRPLCMISGGETLVEVRGKGKGGRCQELAALMMPELEPGEIFLAAGSDGNDGPTDAAGGTADRESWQRILAEGIPYEELLADNDSYRLLERSGNLIKVDPTRNNLMDVYLFLRTG